MPSFWGLVYYFVGWVSYSIGFTICFACRISSSLIRIGFVFEDVMMFKFLENFLVSSRTFLIVCVCVFYVNLLYTMEIHIS